VFNTIKNIVIDGALIRNHPWPNHVVENEKIELAR